MILLNLRSIRELAFPISTTFGMSPNWTSYWTQDNINTFVAVLGSL